MERTRFIRHLGRTDAKLVRRDQLLVSLIFFILIICLALRFGLPWMNTYLAQKGWLPGEISSMTLADLYPMLLAFFVLFQGGLISGTIFGFMLIDEKDQRTIKAMLVTPLPINHYVLYRIGLPYVVAYIIIVAEFVFINQATIPFWQLLLVALGAALSAPIAALFFGVTSQNKVQGFAMSKFVSLAAWIIIIGWFVSEPLQWIFGLFPPFLVSKAYWMILDGSPGWWTALIAGTILQLGMIYWLAQRFKQIAFR